MKKRILSILLAALMLLSAVPLGLLDTAYAAEVVDSGTCGVNAAWSLDSDGVLTISGTGRITNYTGSNSAPWSKHSSDIKKVVIESGVTSIGDYAFYDSKSLTSVTIPGGVTSIGGSAFQYCRSLTYVTIPEGVTSIGGRAFESCRAMTSAQLPTSLRTIGAGAFEYCEALVDMTLPEGLTTIGDSAFRHCESLKSVTVPKSVTKLDFGAFGECTALTSVAILCSDVTIDGSFFGCTALTNVSLPDGLTVIPDNMFQECSALQHLTIPDSVTKIGWKAFKDCTSLAEINIPDGVKSISIEAFAGCSSLTSVVLPQLEGWYDYSGEDITYRVSISAGVFANCTRLTTVYIPHHITNIGKNTFYYCESLKDIYYAGTAAEWAAIEIDSTGNDDLLAANIHTVEPLPAPTVTGSTDSQGRPTLRWNAVSGTSKYEVYRSYSQNGTYTKYSTQTSTAYTNSSYLTSGTTYYYKVRALDANGTAGAWSSIVSVTYRAVAGTLPAPTVTGGNDSQGRPTLKWNAVSGAAKYEVYRARSLNGDYIKYSTVTGTSYTNTSYIENGTTYYYKVRALKSDGTAGAWSSVVSVTYKQTLPAPAVTGGNDSQGRPTLTWKAVSGASKYEVYRARSKSGDYIKYSTVTGTSYTNTSYIESGNTYYYKVRALDANGTAGAWSSIVSVTYRAAAGTLSAPTVTGSTDSQGRPTLKWSAVSGAAKYEVYRSYSRDGSYSKYSTQSSTSYTNSSYLTSGTTYYYKVRALDANGTAGAWSSVVSVTYRAAAETLPAPSVTGGNDSQGRPTLKWNAISGASKYEVYRSYSKNGTYTKYSTQTSTAYTNSSYLTDGTTYYYKVRALKSDGTAGAYSSVVSVTYKQTLPAPTVTGGTDSQGRPTLTWGSVTGAAKYEVYRSYSQNGTYTKYSTVTGTSYTNTAYLTDGTTYYYKVRALNANNTAGAYSSVVSVTYTAIN